MMQPQRQTKLKLIVFSLIPLVSLLVIFELIFVFCEKFIPRNQLKIDPLASYQDLPPLFEGRTIEGKEVLFSRFFPSRYYSSIQDYSGKFMALEKDPLTYRLFVYGGSDILLLSVIF